jgi:hypothetical protein
VGFVRLVARLSIGALLAVAIALPASRPALAQSAAVPASIQADLLSKLEGYDRNFAARAGNTARVLILVKPGNTKSELSAAEMRSALSRIDRIGGLPHQEVVLPFENADALVERCRSDHIAVIYITTGFEQDIDALRTSLSNANVLTLGAVSAYVPQGAVLGFELESGKPKIVINLEQARRQGVNFPPDLVRLMRVYR